MTDDISVLRSDILINKATKQQLDISTALANITTKSITILFFGLVGTLSSFMTVLLVTVLLVTVLLAATASEYMFSLFKVAIAE
jgi:hypothetical protein